MFQVAGTGDWCDYEADTLYDALFDPNRVNPENKKKGEEKPMPEYDQNRLLLLLWANDNGADKWSVEKFIAGTDTDREEMKTAFAEWLHAIGKIGTVYDFGWMDNPQTHKACTCS